MTGVASSKNSTQRRRRPPRQEARRVLVVTEGTETEPQYVERLDAFLRSSEFTTHVKRVGVGKDPLRVVEKCVELRDKADSDDKPYDICVCLVDVDQHSTLEEACRLARNESILVLISNLKFEVWLRWHVEESRSVLPSDRLDQLVSKLGLLQGKALTAKFPIESVYAAYTVALKADPDLAACRKGPDPSTAMPLLVDLLRGQL